MAGNKNRFTREFQDLLDQKQNVAKVIPGKLGRTIDGVQRINVPGRSGFAYVRLRGDPSEVIEALNDAVPAVYSLPVLVEWDTKSGRYYRITGRDLSNYSDMPGGSQIGSHGAQHSFGSGPGAGIDPVWVFKRQFMPFLVSPYSALTVRVADEWYLWEGQYNHFTGSFVDLTNALPSSGYSRFITLYVDGDNNTIAGATGTDFATYPFPSNFEDYFSVVGAETGIPLAAVLLSSNLTTVTWNQIYDLRSIFSGLSPSMESQRILLKHPATNAITTFEVSDAGLDAASAAAVSGDRVFLPDYAYTANHTLKEGVTYIGDSIDGVVFSGQLTFNFGSELYFATIQISANDGSAYKGIITPNAGSGANMIAQFVNIIIGQSGAGEVHGIDLTEGSLYFNFSAIEVSSGGTAWPYYRNGGGTGKIYIFNSLPAGAFASECNDLTAIEPVAGDRSVVDVVDFPARHAADLPSSPVHHVPAPSTAGNTIMSDGSKWVLQMKWYNQAGEPSLASGQYAIWTDSDDGKMYLVANNGVNQKKVELV